MLLALDARNRSLQVGFRAGYWAPSSPRGGAGPSPAGAALPGAALSGAALSGAAGALPADDAAVEAAPSAWLALRRFGVSADRSADEYAFFLEAAAAVAARAAPDDPVDAVWISSVVPALTPRLAEAALTAFGVAASVVGPGARTGMKIRTDNPAEVGSDLVCSALAARELLGPPCVVVDFGAALAISAVNAAGEFVGAAIAPGLETAAESLRSSAALIPEVRLEEPPRAIGRSTSESVRAGLFLGYGGLVARLVALMRAELGPGEPLARVVGTGDPAGRALLASAGEGRFESSLVLDGIAIVAALAR